MHRICNLVGASLLAGGLGLSAPVLAEQPQVDLEDDTARLNYSLGYQIGGDFKRQGVEMDADAVVQGIADALAGDSPQLPPDEMQALLVDLKRRVNAAELEKRLNKKQNLLNEGAEFMAANAQKEGVQQTESGLQYRIIQTGAGRRPTAKDRVTVNYQGRFVNGQGFDAGEQASFDLDSAIIGWAEGLQLIGEGGSIELIIPPELAFDDRGPLAHKTLIYEIELIAVNEPGAEQARNGAT